VARVPAPPIEELGPRYRYRQQELAAALTEQAMAAKERQVRRRPQQLRQEPLPQVLNLHWLEPNQPRGRVRGLPHRPVLDPGTVTPVPSHQVQNERHSRSQKLFPQTYLLALPQQACQLRLEPPLLRVQPLGLPQRQAVVVAVAGLSWALEQRRPSAQAQLRQ